VAHLYYLSKMGNLRKTTKNITGAAKAQTSCRLNSLLFARDQDGAGHRLNCTSVLGNGKKECKPSQADDVGVELSTENLKKIPSHLSYLYREKCTDRLQIRRRF